MTKLQMIKKLGVVLCTTSLITGMYVIWFQPEFIKLAVWTHLVLCGGFTIYLINNKGEE